MNKEYTILLVDDDEDDRQIFKDAIAHINSHISCLTAEDGKKALSLLESLTILPDIIFLDLNMPGMDGKHFLQVRATIERFIPIPVVVYSTTKRPQDEDETRKLGVVNFITKPVAFKDISTIISRVLKENGGYTGNLN